MATATTQQTEILSLYQSLFGAAAGTVKMNTYLVGYTDMNTLAAALMTDPAWTAAGYGTTPAAIYAKFISGIAGNAVNGADQAPVVQYLVDITGTGAGKLTVAQGLALATAFFYNNAAALTGSWGTVAKTLVNKVAVDAYYSIDMNGANPSSTVAANVTDTVQSVTDAKALIGQGGTVDPSSTSKVLTAADDYFVGTLGNDNFTGNQTTVQVNDYLKDSSTTDSDNLDMSFTNTGGNYSLRAENIENVTIRANLSSANSAFGFTYVTGLKNLIFEATDGSAFAAPGISYAMRDLQSTSTVLTAKDTEEDILFNYDTQATDGTNTVNVNVYEMRDNGDDVTAGQAAADIFITENTTDAEARIETINLASLGGIANNIDDFATDDDGNGTVLSTLNISGDTDLKIEQALDSKIATLNAGTLNANLNLNMTASANAVTYTGALGNDTVTFQGTAFNNTISTGTGNDNLIMGAGDESIDMGAGADILRADALDLTTADVIVGGAGYDSIWMSGSDSLLLSETERITGFEKVDLAGTGSVIAVHNNLVTTAENAQLELVSGVTNTTFDLRSLSVPNTVTITDDNSTTNTDEPVDSSNAGIEIVQMGDAQLDGKFTLNLDEDKTRANLDSRADEVQIYNTATLTVDDTAKFSGVDIIRIRATDITGQTYNLHLSDALVQQSTTYMEDNGFVAIGTKAVNIIVDNDVPVGSVINLINTGMTMNANVTITYGANVTVTQTGPAVNTETLLRFTPNADNLVGTTNSDTFIAENLSYVQGADLADGNAGAADTLQFLFNINSGNDLRSVALNNVAIRNMDVFDFTNLTTGQAFAVDNINNGAATTFNLTNAADTITDGTGVIAANVINARGGNDTVNFAGAGVAVTINGGDGDDTLTGDTGADVISGDAGNDTIVGGNGANTLAGGDGNDAITGGTGVDAITGGAGNDTIIAGGAADNITGGTGADSITLTAGGANIETLSIAAADSNIGAAWKKTDGTLWDTVTGYDQANPDLINIHNVAFIANISAGIVTGQAAVDGSNAIRSHIIGNQAAVGGFAASLRGEIMFASDAAGLSRQLIQTTSDFQIAFEYILKNVTQNEAVYFEYDTTFDGVSDGLMLVLNESNGTQTTIDFVGITNAAVLGTGIVISGANYTLV
jgi:hypothetical protein